MGGEDEGAALRRQGDRGEPCIGRAGDQPLAQQPLEIGPAQGDDAAAEGRLERSADPLAHDPHGQDVVVGGLSHEPGGGRIAGPPCLEHHRGDRGAAADAPIDWGTVLPVADVKAGEAVFAKCKSCHTIEAGGPNGTGPNLHGVLGRISGTHAGFAYSPAMVEHGKTVGAWTFEELSEFVAAPQKHTPGTKMTFVGLKKPEDRINLIAYLNTQGSNLPFPAPKPAAAAAPAADGAAAPAAAEGAPAAPAEGAAAPAAGAAPAAAAPAAK